MRKVASLVAFALWAFPSAARADLKVYENQDLGAPIALDLYGWVQPRFSLQQQDTRPQVNFTPNPAFTVTRARMGTYATYGDWGRVQFEMDIAPATVEGIDAYLVARPVHEKLFGLDFQLGQFRVPFSRQNLLSSKSYQFSDNAYFVAPKFIVDRDIGAQIGVDLFGGVGRLMGGVFNGNDPGRGQTLNIDKYFLFAARAEISPLGPAPRFEGDLRSLEERHKPVVTLAGGVMKNRAEDKFLNRTYLGADLGFWWEGFSLYAEYYHRRDEPTPDAPLPPPNSPPTATNGDSAVGWNIQAGYFPPLPVVREHFEVVVRVQRFNPSQGTPVPGNDSGERDLDQSNPTWGYLGIQFGLNAFAFASKGHDFKLQGSYEIRDETKPCLTGQGGDVPCTGQIKNNLFLLQATAAF